MTFTAEEIRDLINGLDILTGSYVPELRDEILARYAHDTPSWHRTRATFHKLNALMCERLKEGDRANVFPDPVDIEPNEHN